MRVSDIRDYPSPQLDTVTKEPRRFETRPSILLQIRIEPVWKQTRSETPFQQISVPACRCLRPIKVTIQN